jgi:hypothetical protein
MTDGYASSHNENIAPITGDYDSLPGDGATATKEV